MGADKRRLYAALALAISFLLSNPALACRFCQEAEERRADRVQEKTESGDLPYRLDSDAPRLSKRELALLLSIPGDDGRPRFQSRSLGYIHDRGNPGDAHLLRPQQVETLVRSLGTSSVERLARIRGKLSGADRAALNELYFQRMPYLNKQDQEAVRELRKRHLGDVDIASPFAGRQSRVEAPDQQARSDKPLIGPIRLAGSTPKPAPAQPPLPQRRPSLTGRAWIIKNFENFQNGLKTAFDEVRHYTYLNALKTNLIIEDNGKPEQRRALDEILHRLVRSPTAREYTLRYLEQLDQTRKETGSVPKIKLSFKEMEGSKVYTGDDGHLTFNGTRGVAYPTREPIEVYLNPNFIATSKSRIRAANTLAHELFGHGFSQLQINALAESERENVKAAWSVHLDDETQSRLIGWTVHAELLKDAKDRGEKIPVGMDTKFSGTIWDIIRNPAEYYTDIILVSDDYAQWLTRDQMRGDPLAEFKRRLVRAKEDLKWYQDRVPEMEEDLRIIEHFSGKAHPEYKPEQFEHLKKYLTRRVKITYPYWIKDGENIVEAVEKSIKKYSPVKGKKGENPELNKIRLGAEHGFFSNFETEMAFLTIRLNKLLKGKTRETTTTKSTWPKGQITRKELWAMSSKDLARHPKHKD